MCAFIGIKPGCGSNMSVLPIFLVLSRFFTFIQVSQERDRLWVSLCRGGLLGFVFVASVKAATPGSCRIDVPSSAQPCRWGAAAVKAERPCCLQGMKSALWAGTVVWGGRTLFTAGLWQFMLSVLSFSHSCGELGQFCGWPGDPSSSLWECE